MACSLSPALSLLLPVLHRALTRPLSACLPPSPYSAPSCPFLEKGLATNFGALTEHGTGQQGAASTSHSQS